MSETSLLKLKVKRLERELKERDQKIVELQNSVNFFFNETNKKMHRVAELIKERDQIEHSRAHCAKLAMNYKNKSKILENKVIAYKELQEHTYSECIRYVNQLDSNKAIIAQLLESIALYQIECDDLNYEIQQYRTNNIFLLDLVKRLSS